MISLRSFSASKTACSYSVFLYVHVHIWTYMNMLVHTSFVVSVCTHPSKKKREYNNEKFENWMFCGHCVHLLHPNRTATTNTRRGYVHTYLLHPGLCMYGWSLAYVNRVHACLNNKKSGKEGESLSVKKWNKI